MTRLFLLLGVLTSPLLATAEVRVSNVYTDHAVLQRERPIHIWGYSAPEEHVTVDFHAQKVQTTATVLGLWEVSLKPERAGGPYTLKISGDSTATPLVRTDLLVGDVWIASGQSNMEMPLKGFSSAPVKESDKEIAAANHPNLRLFLQTRRSSPVPKLDTDNVWQVCTPETAKNFSAVAYFFSRKIMQEEHVPIGIVDATWGGTPAHSWISAEGIAWANLPSVSYDSGAIFRDQGTADAVNDNLKAQDAILTAAGKTPPTHPRVPGSRDGAWNPSGLYNGMIAPFTGMSIRGFLWYQGETDHEGIKALNYSRVFPALIQDWRKHWAEGPLPFLWVQIASYDSPGDGWAQVRDAQRRTLELRNTGMAVALDVGLPKNIHPPDKQTVASRLAQSALGIAYGKNVETSSPDLVDISFEGPAIRAWFSHATGLTSRNRVVGDFEVAGVDGKFVAATATIEHIGDQSTVVASAPTVPSPRYIRYGWAPYVRTYLYNASGLPLGTFTSVSDSAMLVP